jgi:hypothetical protein
MLLLCLSTLLWELTAVGMQSSPFSLSRIWLNVTTPGVTSYFTDASGLIEQKDVLRNYPALMPRFHLHSMTKPPGPVLFYRTLIQWFGHPDFSKVVAPDKLSLYTLPPAALAGGLLLGLLGACAAPAVYFLCRAFKASERAAFAAASCMALSASLVLFYPEFDQAYPILSCGILGTWVLALRENRPLYALVCGAILSLATFMAYNLLVLGIFMAGYGVARILMDRRLATATAVARLSGMTLGIVTAFYLLLNSATGFDPFATFAVALPAARAMLSSVHRYWPASILFDLQDYLLGLNWIVLAPAAICIAVRLRRPRNEEFYLLLLCLVQVVGVALFGVLPSETARTWLFLFPLLLFPAGMELHRWNLTSRGVFYAALFLLMIVICQNMLFLEVRLT